jgi:hypothetical protein
MAEVLQLGLDPSGAESGARRYVRSIDEVRAANRKAGDSTDTLDDRFRSLARGADQATGGFARMRSAALMIRGPFAALAGYGIYREFERIVDATDSASRSIRQLNATARLLDVSFGLLDSTSESLERRLGLTDSVADSLTGAMAKLASRAGDVNRTGDGLIRFLDLAAANGIAAASAGELLNNILAGQDEGLNRLGLANPSQIYQKWGASSDQASQSLAILNELMAAGGKVAGSYGDFMDDAAGKQERANAALADARAALGEAFAPTRVAAIEAMTDAFTGMADAIRQNEEAIRSLFSLFSGLANTAGWIHALFTPPGAPNSFQQRWDRQFNPGTATVGPVQAIPADALQRLADNRTLIGHDRAALDSLLIAERMAEIRGAGAIARPLAPIDKAAEKRAQEELRRALEDLVATIR